MVVRPKIGIKTKLTQLFRDLPLKKSLYVSLVLAVIDIFIVLLLKRRLPPEVPLFYGLPEGEGQLTTSSFGLLITGVFSLSVIALNTSAALFVNDEFIQKTLMFTESVVAFMCLFTTLEIIFLVGNL
jgi:hypothetical protein